MNVMNETRMNITNCSVKLKNSEREKENTYMHLFK